MFLVLTDLVEMVLSSPSPPGSSEPKMAVDRTGGREERI
jgi:hypothetical protein